MIITSLKRPWEKNKCQGHKIHNDDYYKSSAWKSTVDRIWIRDKGLCQMCLEKGITHNLQRGTRDLELQGTVDHKLQRMHGGADTDDNLWLIGSNHHNAKRAEEKNNMYKK